MKNKLIVVLVITIILSFGAVVAIAGANYFKEPARSKDVPDDVVWNPQSGTYVLKEPVMEVNSISNAAQEKVENPKYNWYIKHKDSTDVIDKALVNWIDNVDKQLGLYSWYDPDKDAAFQKYMLPLGVNKLSEIYNRIKNDNVWDGFLMTSLSKITKIKDLEYVSVTPEGKKEWMNKLKEKAKKAKDGFDNAKDLKSEKGNLSVEKNIEDLGILSLPMLDEQSKKGNQSAKSYLGKISDNDTKNIDLIKDFIQKVLNDN